MFVAFLSRHDNPSSADYALADGRCTVEEETGVRLRRLGPVKNVVARLARPCGTSTERPQ